MRVQDHVSGIEDALDDFARDSTIPLSEYVTPSYETKSTLDEAMALAHSWARDMDDSDTIDVIDIDTVTGSVARIDGSI